MADNAHVPRSAVRTFLFADLRDYTAFVESRGDAQATRLLRAYRRIVRAEVAARKGAEIKTEGDSFYVVFELPGDAIRCAISIQRKAKKHTEEHPELPLRFGIGVNTGEAVPHDNGYVGAAVIVASRLSTHAPAGAVVITETVRGLLRTAALAPMRDLGAWALKGIAHPIRVFEIETTPMRSSRESLAPALSLPPLLAAPNVATGIFVCPELVQRETPMSALLQHLGAAAAGQTRVVALSGEAGIGKSRLGRELARVAHADGFYVFGGRSHARAATPYEPFIAALRPYAHARGIEVLKRLLGPLMSELRRLLPEMQLGPDTMDVSQPDEQRRDRFFRTIHLLLEDAAAQRPVVLVLEDLHDADPATRDLLAYLATTLRAGICLLFTFREEEVDSTHPLRPLLADLERQRQLATLRLVPLDGAGVARMTAALLPGRATPELARAVHERSEGVPFYVEELLKTAVDDPAASGEHLALPRTVADSVQVRMRRLAESRGTEAADLLEVAAVAGIPLGYDVLVRLSQRAEPEAAADIAAAVDAQLLERIATRTEIYQFRHALTREAVEAGIAPARRRRLHLRVAETIESLVTQEARAAIVTRHFAAAGEPAKALRYAREGAASASHVGAFAAAIDLLRQAAAIAEGGDHEQPVLEDLGHALQSAGRALEAEATLERARLLASAAHDAIAVARVDTSLASVLRMQGRRAEAIAATMRAIAALEAKPGEALADAIATHAALAWAETDATQAASLARRALTIARKHHATRCVVSALTTLGAALARSGDPDGIVKLEEAIRLGREAGQHSEAATAYLELSLALQGLGRWEPSRAAAQAGADLAGERGLEFARASLLSQLASVLVTVGRYRDARAVAEQAVTLARPGTLAATTARAMLADALTMLGEHATALAFHDQIAPEMERAEPDRRAFFLGSRARALLGLGRHDDAWATARAGVDLVVETTPGAGVTSFLIAADVIEARQDAAGLRWLMRTFDRQFVGRDIAPIRVLRAEMRAMQQALKGEDAAAAFADVAVGYAAIGVPIRAAYRRGSAALARRERAGQRREANRELATVRAELLERGALRYLQAIDAKRKRPPAQRRP